MKSIGYFIFCLVCGAVFLGATSNSVLPIFQEVRAETTQEAEARRAQLQAELEAEEREIAKQTALLQSKQKETATVQGELNLLKSQIKQAQTNIKAKKVEISRLDSDIAVREGKVSALDLKIKSEQDSLAELLRKSRDYDSSSLAEIILDNKRLSDFFDELDSIGSVQQSIHQSFARLRGAQDAYEQEMIALAVKKDKELDAKAAIETQQKVIEKKESQKKVVLTINKNQEQAYQTVLAERQRKAAAIRAALFGLRDTAAIPFGKALEYAVFASDKTGTRPAFVLAIIKQESELGANVGTCNRPQDARKWNQIMPGPAARQNYLALGKSCKNATTACSSRDDQTPFLNIMSSLGRSPEGTPLSCPILSAGPWGGAMGPAQFIPSTWNGLKTQIASLLGKSAADPWEPKDAIMASSLFLSQLGGSGGAYSSEIKAACKYYGSGGTTCSYGRQVMAKAQDIQLNMVDLLQNN